MSASPSGRHDRAQVTQACPWTARVWKEFRAGNLTRTFRDVLLTLRTFKGAGGFCVPSHATLADRARCSIRTVQRALSQGDHLGLVEWRERRAWKGWRWLRTSNRYSFIIPETPVTAGMRLRRRSTGQPVRGGESVKKERPMSPAKQLIALGIHVDPAACSAAFRAASGL